MASPDFGVFEDWNSKKFPRPAAVPAPTLNTGVAPDFGVFENWGSAEGRSLRSANMGPKTPAGWTPPAEPTLRAGGLSRTLLNGSSVYDAGASASKAAMRAGAKMAKPALGVAGSAFGVLPHAAAYADDAIPYTDRAKIIGTDVLRMGGTALGGCSGRALVR